MFLIYKREVADVEPFEYVDGANDLTLGGAVKFTAGKLAKCAAADMPTHIVMGPKNGSGQYPVIRVLPTTIFETTSTAAITADKVGTAVQMSATADSVTATAGGAFIVTETENAANGVVRGYFKEPAAAAAG